MAKGLSFFDALVILLILSAISEVTPSKSTAKERIQYSIEGNRNESLAELILQTNLTIHCLKHKMKNDTKGPEVAEFPERMLGKKFPNRNEHLVQPNFAWKMRHFWRIHEMVTCFKRFFEFYQRVNCSLRAYEAKKQDLGSISIDNGRLSNVIHSTFALHKVRHWGRSRKLQCVLPINITCEANIDVPDIQHYYHKFLVELRRHLAKPSPEKFIWLQGNGLRNAKKNKLRSKTHIACKKMRRDKKQWRKCRKEHVRSMMRLTEKTRNRSLTIREGRSS